MASILNATSREMNLLTAKVKDGEEFMGAAKEVFILWYLVLIFFTSLSSLSANTASLTLAVNGLKDKFGKLTSLGRFEPIPLDARVGEQGGRGVVVNAVVRFYAKASTDNKQSINSVTPSSGQQNREGVPGSPPFMFPGTPLLCLSIHKIGNW
jgi:hypothetical protein